MLSREENELLTRVGPGTPMGEMLRRYWVPACLSEEISGPDCDPVRVRLLGEDLVAFRDTNGRLGLLGEHCSHRGASLFFGRNEESGLRCLYHGWKMDVNGNVLETPCEPMDSTFKHRVKHLAYPVREQGDVIWTYMGPPEKTPEFPNFGWTLAPKSQRCIGKIDYESNFLQAIEGAIDSSHTNMLHTGYEVMRWTQDQIAKVNARPSRDSTGRLEAEDRPYGFRYAAIRKPLEEPDQYKYVRITLFVLPFHCFTPRESDIGCPHMFVPADDEHTWFYDVIAYPDKPVDQERYLAKRHLLVGTDLDKNYRKLRNLQNNYMQDRAAMKSRKESWSYSGIAWGNPHQDMSQIETMGPIYDRTKEHLGASDTAIIRMRHCMLDAVRAFMDGQEPPGLDRSIPFENLRGELKVVPVDTPWQAVGVNS